MKAVFFDLDGTLVESLPGLTEALNRTLTDLNKDKLPQSIVKTYVGDGLWMLLRRALPQTEFSDKQVAEQQTPFQHHYKDTWRSGTMPFVGAKELLNDLAQAGIALGVLSNKPHRFTVEITEELFGRDLVRHIQGQTEGIPKKPDPGSLIQLFEAVRVPPSEAVFVGDSTIDLQAAVNAETNAIGVTWGYHNSAELEKYKQPLANTMGELRSLLLPGQ